jgi:glyoxylate reductase
MPDNTAQLLVLNDFPSSAVLWSEVEGLVPVKRLDRCAVLEQSLPDVTLLLPLITDRVDASLLDRLPNLRLIANYGAGVDNIDVAEATRRGIQVTNTPGVLSESVADLTWGLLLAAARRIVESDATMRKNAFPGWTPTYQLGTDVYGKTLGILGLGQIGKAVARRAVGFGMTLLYTGRTRLSQDQEHALGVEYRTLEGLLAESDVVSLHLPATPETHHLISAQTLAKMRPGAILINTSRGSLVDEAALAKALTDGPLGAAGLDVFEKEPLVHPDLLPLSNVVLTAHIGSATLATRQRMGDAALRNLLAFLRQQPVPNPVNRV